MIDRLFLSINSFRIVVLIGAFAFYLFLMTVSVHAESIPPKVKTNPATNVDARSAQLNGAVLDIGTAIDVDVSFEWGTNDSYGNETPIQTLNQAGPFSFVLEGLESQTEYHFRTKINGEEVVFGSDSVFTTSNILYVNSNIGPGGDGTSWSRAFNNLQSALYRVDDVGTPCEIWVAEGIYTPTTEVGGVGPRFQAFQMKDDVRICGGFPNSGSPMWNQRNWEINKTVLSGEIGNPWIKDDNCYHVFNHPRGLRIDNSAVLNGFTVTDGYANGTFPENGGGGMHCQDYSSPTLLNCVFEDNYASASGGGVVVGNSSIVVNNCIFKNNTADTGGGLKLHASPWIPASVTNCVFSDNVAYLGAAIQCEGNASVIIQNGLFIGNIASGRGGAIQTQSASAIELINCVFTNNQAPIGGVIYTYWGAQSKLINCTLSNNTADMGNSLACDAFQQTGPSTVQITNCILWNGVSEVWNNDNSNVTITYSNVLITPGSPVYPGIGNISGTPMFVRPGSGDFHLLPTSPCIDSGSNAAILATGVTEDFDGDDRIIHGTADMGVDEHWSCTIYDDDLSEKIEYIEMVEALMDYLTSQLGYRYMVDVLMCYLTG